MEYIVRFIMKPFDLYNWMMSRSDPRTINWPLCNNPFPILCIIFSYLYFVKIYGPRWMKTRPPFKIDKILVVYNILMVIFSAVFFIYGGSYSYLYPWGPYSWVCEPIDYSTSPKAMVLPSLAWWFMLLKIFEFLDTIFFVLRKKFDHITHLHVIHHSLVAFGIWSGMKYGIGGTNIFFPFVNCFIHVLMYGYYGVAAMGPKWRKYLWWKKYLTILQIVQFVVVIIHAILPFFYDCGYHKGFLVAIFGHATLFMIMFMNFYQQTYKKNRKEALERKAFAAKVNAQYNNAHRENGEAIIQPYMESRNSKIHQKAQ